MAEAAGAPAVYRVAELARLLDMGRRQTYEAITRGEIPCRKIGASVRCSKVAIHAWLDGATANGEEGAYGHELTRAHDESGRRDGP